MPKAVHIRAADHHESAAKSHRQAASNHDKDDKAAAKTRSAKSGG